MISDNVYIILFKKVYYNLVECIQKQHPTIDNDFLEVCLNSSSVFSHFERLSSSVAAVVHSALLKSGLNEISDEIADDVISFIKSNYPVYERWVNISVDKHFSKLLGYIHDCTRFLFRLPKMIVSKDHGWTEFIEYRECSDLADYERRIAQAENTLSNQIDQWKERYVITAPYDGIVSLQNVWNKGQHVSVGDLIASVSPARGMKVQGRLKVPSSGFGQDVNIKLNGLESTYNKTLPFVQDMDGTAEIITGDMRLIEQFIRPIRSLFVNR